MTASLTPAQRRGLSVGVATGLYGISFGALAVAAGLSVAQACALSLLMFTGGSQFAFVGVVAGGGSLASATAAASLLGVRNAVYAVTADAMLRPRGWRRFAAAHVTIDESIATASAAEDPAEERRGFWAAGVAVFVLWNVFTLVGALAGNALGDPKAWGLDGAAVAAFLGLLWPRLRGRDPIAIAVVCAVVTVLVAPVVPAGIPIIVAAGVAVVLTIAQRRRSPTPEADPHPRTEAPPTKPRRQSSPTPQADPHPRTEAPPTKPRRQSSPTPQADPHPRTEAPPTKPRGTSSPTPQADPHPRTSEEAGPRNGAGRLDGSMAQPGEPIPPSFSARERPGSAP